MIAIRLPGDLPTLEALPDRLRFWVETLAYTKMLRAMATSLGPDDKEVWNMLERAADLEACGRFNDQIQAVR